MPDCRYGMRDDTVLASHEVMACVYQDCSHTVFCYLTTDSAETGPQKINIHQKRSVKCGLTVSLSSWNHLGRISQRCARADKNTQGKINDKHASVFTLIKYQDLGNQFTEVDNII